MNQFELVFFTCFVSFRFLIWCIYWNIWCLISGLFHCGGIFGHIPLCCLDYTAKNAWKTGFPLLSKIHPPLCPLGKKIYQEDWMDKIKMLLFLNVQKHFMYKKCVGQDINRDDRFCSYLAFAQCHIVVAVKIKSAIFVYRIHHLYWEILRDTSVVPPKLQLFFPLKL